MEELERQVNYLKQYIQRQENLFLEFTRKNVDFEIKILALNSSLAEMTSKYEESQKQVEIQNDIMKQATNSIEALTLQKENLEELIENLKKNLQVCNNENIESKNKLQTLEQKLKASEHHAEELLSEYKRQTTELNELNSKSRKLEDTTKINKKVKKPATLSSDEF